MKNKPLLILAVLGTACVTFSSSCKKESVSNQTKTVQNDANIATLKKAGFKTDGIIDKGSYYIIEGDIMLQKNAAILNTKLPLLALSPKESGQRPPEIDQARTDYTVTQSTVTVKVDASIPSDLGTDDWHAAISAALGYWNAIPNNRIVFSLITSGTADIVIQSDGGLLDANGLNNVVAISQFPSTTNKPGNMIMINLNFNSNYNVSAGQKAYNMVHELGHTIGYRHTNWTALGESTYGTATLGSYTFNTYGANLINGTRNSSDGGSVMNGGTALNSWNGFSVFDILAQRTVYPLDATQVPIYRYASSNRHFYTASWSELGLSGAGFTYEGPASYLYNYAKTGTVPFYREYNSSSNDHFYTTSNTIPVGYGYEGTLGYVYTTQVTGTIPLYRYFKTSGGHFYTTDINELGGGNNQGYTYDGIACYVVK